MIRLIKEQLTHIYEGDPWYGGSITTVLESVNPNHVFESPNREMHSIVEILAHMLSWREFVEQRLSGDDKYFVEQEKSFDWKRFSTDRKCAWNSMRDRLKTNQQHLLDLLQNHDDSLLEQKVAGKPYSYLYLLNGILQHDLYHLGQIVYINKLLNKDEKEPIQGGILRYDFRIFPFEGLARNK